MLFFISVNISGFLGLLVETYVIMSVAYFLSHLPTNVNQNPLVVSFDVTNVYTSISHSLG